MFDTVQLWPGGGGGGWFESRAAQNLTVFGGGVNGMPSIVIWEVDCQSTPGDSARAGTRLIKSNVEAARSRTSKCLIICSPISKVVRKVVSTGRMLPAPAPLPRLLSGIATGLA